jgi:hypothetical protein
MIKIVKKVPATTAKPAANKAKPATVAKPTVEAPKLGKGVITAMAAIGLRGIVLCKGTLHGETHFAPSRDHNGQEQEFQARSVKLGESVPAVWKGNGSESLWGKAVGAYVSPAGENYKLVTLAHALKAKLIRPVKMLADGKPFECFVPFNWTTKQFLPQYVGVATSLGRFEPKLHKDGAERQGGAHVKLELAKGAK